MKKFISFLIILVLTFLQGYIVIAQEQDYYIEELGVTMSVPDGFDVFTRGMDKNNSLFYEYGLDPDLLEASFDETGTYLYATNWDGTYDIELSIQEVSYDDFSKLSDIALEYEADVIEDTIKEVGYDVISNEIYHGKHTKYIRTYVDTKEYGIKYIQYFTVMNEMVYIFSVKAYDCEFSEDILVAFDSMINNLTFDSEPLLEELWEKTEPFVYTSEYSGISFKVPADYKLDEMSKKDFGYGEMEGVSFVSTHDEGIAIIYSSMDLYDVADSGFYGFERSEIDFSFLTEDVIYENVGAVKDIEEVNFNDIPYYKAIYEYVTDIEGETINLDVKTFLTLKDGWYHQFLLIDTDKGIYYNDLIELLESADYPYIPSKTPIVTLPGIIILALVLIVYLLKRKLKPKKKLTVTDDQFKDQNDSSNLTAEENRCPECGALLLTGSERCYKCGKDINKV